MLRDLPQLMVILIGSLMTVLFLGFFYSSSTIQDSTVLDMNESVRTMAISNANLRSRTKSGELFIVKSDFEEDVIERLASGNNALSEDDDYEFEYLDNENGSTKAIRLKVEADNGKHFQTTVVVDIAE